MIGTIEWVGNQVRTYQTRNGEMKSCKIAVRFQGAQPTGLPADCYREDGTIFGEVSFKTKQPAVGQTGDIDCIVRQFPSGDSYVAFKRKQAAGVPMNGSANGNGHHAPASQHSSPVLPVAEQPTWIEFLARYRSGLIEMRDTYKDLFPNLTPAEVAALATEAMGAFRVQWLRESGCQMPPILPEGMKAYTTPAAEDAQTGEEIPF